MMRELFKLGRRNAERKMDSRQEERMLPGFRLQQWYVVLVAAFYVYGYIFKNLLQDGMSPEVLPHGLYALVLFSLSHHDLVTFGLYMLGLINFVFTLKKGWFRYQFAQYAWTIMAVVFVVTQTSYCVASILQGLIWFVLPVLLVVANDCLAYFSGFFFGRTPLLTISPKKTWEGFIGGGILTIALAVPLSRLFSRHLWMVCPRTNFTLGPLNCEPASTFVFKEVQVQDLLPTLAADMLRQGAGWVGQAPLAARILSGWVWTAPMDLHAMVLAVFASLCAPFAGFFASGFKRALKIKDFGDTIPGHGGVVDRMDCQCLMSIFAFLYFRNFVIEKVVHLGDALTYALALPPHEQVELFTRMGYLLVGSKQVPESVLSELAKIHTHNN